MIETWEVMTGKDMVKWRLIGTKVSYADYLQLSLVDIGRTYNYSGK